MDAHLSLFSVAAAVTVSTIYVPQPMLANLASDLGIEPTFASIVVTAAQAGYALGVLVLVPLADRVPPRRRVTVQSLLPATALIVTSFMPVVAAAASSRVSWSTSSDGAS